MKISKIWLISFSPTRTSKKIVDAIASGLQGIPCEGIDLTYPNTIPELQFGPDELVIIGVPVYAGRVAPLAVKRLATLQGSNTPAVITVTYGNREFEDALIELIDLVGKAAFSPLAGGAFIGEHSFSGPETPIAKERPDSADLAIAKAFGVKIMEKISMAEEQGITDSLEVPGDSPYRDGMGPLPFTPAVNQSECTQCGECLATCPTGAISLETSIELDSNLCIFCCACIKICPEAALEIAAEPIQQKRQWLYENCSERKEPELFL